MKHLLTVCVLLAFVAHHYDAVTFDCLYSIDDWVILDKTYGCAVQKLKKIADGDQTLVSVSKNHLKGKKNEDVQTLNIENATLHKLPKNIDKYFPNLRALRVAQAKLRTIESDDLKPFPKLRVLCLWANELTTLDGNLLANNPSLEFINFGSNGIQHVGPNFFKPLKNLVAAYFEENTCINNTKQFAIEDLKFEVAVKCPPSFEMVELTLINNGVLATKNDELESKIKLLEERITLLEGEPRK